MFLRWLIKKHVHEVFHKARKDKFFLLTNRLPPADHPTVDFPTRADMCILQPIDRIKDQLCPFPLLSLPLLQYVLDNLFKCCLSIHLVVPELWNDIPAARIVEIYLSQACGYRIVDLLT